MNKILTAGIIPIFFAAVIIPSLSSAQTGNIRMRNSGLNNGNFMMPNATSTNMGQGMNAQNRDTNPSCMADAIEKRDNALITALDSKNNSLKAALTTRKNSLSGAWRNLTGTERYKAIRSAWKAYGTSVKQTQNEFKNSRKAAWDQFEKEKRPCKTELRSTVDRTNSSVDAEL